MTRDRDVAILTRGLTKNFGARPAVVGLDLEVCRGEVFGFLGPNGAGKSTTIRMLLDQLRPSSGEIEVLGARPRATGVENRRRIGYLPGDFVIWERQTVGAALNTLARLRGGVTGPQLDRLYDRLDLDPGRIVRELSKGNRQKVGLAQAFMGDPELLILDEPSSGLDPILRREFIAMVDEVRADGRTVFLSSHILSEVQATAERVAMIRSGRLVTTDTIASLREHAVRRVEIHFNDVVDESAFSALPNLVDVMVATADGTSILTCRLTGAADALVKTAAGYTVRTLLVEEPDLDEVFLTLYESGHDGDA